MKKSEKTPKISPYAFPVVLAAMGLWCFFDGWFSADPSMQKHLMFNRVVSMVLLCWSAIDFFRTYKAGLQEKPLAEAEEVKEQNADQS